MKVLDLKKGSRTVLLGFAQIYHDPCTSLLPTFSSEEGENLMGMYVWGVCVIVVG